jgi:hypothetical protein
MSKSVKQKFNFVNIEGKVFHDVTADIVNEPDTAMTMVTNI